VFSQLPFSLLLHSLQLLPLALVVLFLKLVAESIAQHPLFFESLQLVQLPVVNLSRNVVVLLHLLLFLLVFLEFLVLDTLLVEFVLLPQDFRSVFNEFVFVDAPESAPDRI